LGAPLEHVPMKSLLSFVANLLLFMSLSTIVFALGAYFAFKLRQRRPTQQRSSTGELQVLKAYVPKESE
jgi:hypothetical protein